MSKQQEITYDKEKGISRLVDMKTISDAIGITKSGIFQLMKAGKFPKGVKIGSARRWDLEEINRWLKNPKECDSAC